MFTVKIPCKISMIKQNNLWLVGFMVRSLSTTRLSCANHYDVLGITPKATQSDIKSAYYKLSKIYHPDKSSDDASAKKFRAVSEAYQVLGNIKLKKMYDRGLLVGKENTTHMDYQPDPEPTDPMLKFYKSRSRKVATMPDGTAPVYDFDAWSKEHYGDLVRKSKLGKEFIHRNRINKSEKVSVERQEGFIYLMFGLSTLFALMVSYGRDDYDRVQEIQTINSEENSIEPRQDK